MGLVSGWWSVEQWSLCWWLCFCFVFVVMVVWVGLVSGWWSVEQWSLCWWFCFLLFDFCCDGGFSGSSEWLVVG